MTLTPHTERTTFSCLAMPSSQPPSAWPSEAEQDAAPDASTSNVEAICLPDMVHATCIELRPLLAHHQVTLLLSGDARALPRVFGHRARLRAALWECMEAAIVHARLEVDPARSLAMELLFSTDANQVHLTIRSLGAIDEVTLGDQCSGLTAATVSNHHTPPATDTRQHLVFPLARVLLQSLGGNVVVSHADAQGVACTVSLPCLAESEGTSAWHAPHHAQIYAGLLTRLASNDPHPTLSRTG